MAGLRVLACVKRVPAPGAQITLTGDQRAVDARNLAFTTSPHEECAVEEAIRLVEAHGGDITVLTVGPPEAEEQLRFSVSVGAQHAVLVTNDAIASGEDPDPQATARAITDAVTALEADAGPFDVLLFGNESADAGNFQVGVRVARALGRPIVNGIKGIEVADGVLTARRECDAGFEVYRLALPAVAGVKEGINLPRYPTLPGRLRSKKAEVQTMIATAASGGLAMVRFETPIVEITETALLGTGAGAAVAVVDLLYELGLA
ncbi:MAG: electron transfer flavoprotein beta subunit [Actinomycetota bacterium]|jgi:electron transfer flavoprotein beta subunit|nr:electron transfer flavoprotein beta subunit [Actinomycetota bacterium]